MPVRGHASQCACRSAYKTWCYRCCGGEGSIPRGHNTKHQAGDTGAAPGGTTGGASGGGEFPPQVLLCRGALTRPRRLKRRAGSIRPSSRHPPPPAPIGAGLGGVLPSLRTFTTIHKTKRSSESALKTKKIRRGHGAITPKTRKSGAYPAPSPSPFKKSEPLRLASLRPAGQADQLAGSARFLRSTISRPTASCFGSLPIRTERSRALERSLWLCSPGR